MFESEESKYQEFLTYFFGEKDLLGNVKIAQDEKKALLCLQTGTLIKSFDPEVIQLLKADVEQRMSTVRQCIEQKNTITIHEWQQTQALASFALQQGIFKASKGYEDALKLRGNQIIPYLRQYNSSQKYAEADASRKLDEHKLEQEKTEKSSEDLSFETSKALEGFDPHAYSQTIPEEIEAENELFGSGQNPEPNKVLEWLQHFEGNKLTQKLTPEEADRTRGFVALLKAYAAHQGIGRSQDFAEAEARYQQAMIGNFKETARTLYAQTWLDNLEINPAIAYQQAVHYLKEKNEHGDLRIDKLAQMKLGELYLKRFAASIDKEKVSTQGIALLKEGIKNLLFGADLVSVNDFNTKRLSYVFATADPNHLVDSLWNEIKGQGVLKNWTANACISRVLKFLDKGIELNIPQAMYARAALNQKMLDYSKNHPKEGRDGVVYATFVLNENNHVSSSRSIALLERAASASTASKPLADAAIKNLEDNYLNHANEEYATSTSYKLFRIHAFGTPAIAKNEAKAFTYLQEGTLLKTSRSHVMDLIKFKVNILSNRFDMGLAIFVLNHSAKFGFASDSWIKETVGHILKEARQTMKPFQDAMHQGGMMGKEVWEEKYENELQPLLQLNPEKFAKFPDIKKAVEAMVEAMSKIAFNQLQKQGEGIVSKGPADSAVPTTTASTSVTKSSTPMAALLSSSGAQPDTSSNNTQAEATPPLLGFNTVLTPVVQAYDAKKVEKATEELQKTQNDIYDL